MATESSGRRATTYVQLVPNSKNAFCHAFKFLSAKPGNDGTPLADCGGTDVNRPRDIRGSLKVIENILFEHSRPFTTVKERLQPQYQRRGLTSVDMDNLSTIADRLSQAMADADVTASALSRECNVSPAAVHKWLHGGKMSADNSAASARALGVREEWLRTGKLPRERANAAEEKGVDQVVELLQTLREPLAALSAAIDKLTAQTAKEPVKKRSRA